MFAVSRLSSGRVFLSSRSFLFSAAMPPYRHRRPRVDQPRPMTTDTNVAPPPAERAVSPSSSRHFSDRTFQSAPLSKETKDAIKHEFMSDVQAATIDLGLQGKDLLVQAKTGTGKTIAFLLPAIERLAKSTTPRKGISVLVLAPTRELAIQIEKEAEILIKNHKNMSVSHVIGGTRPNQSLNTIIKTPPTILVATPGRLDDHLNDPEIKHQIRAQFAGLQALVYDEADRLLDQGFKPQLDRILSALPSRTTSPRQVMLFSATISKDIREIARKSLSKDHVFVSTLLEDEANTHEHVPQSHVITPFINTFPLTLRILRQDRSAHAPAGTSPDSLASTLPNSSQSLSKSKVIVFFPTARHVCVAYELFKSLPGLPPVYQLHSRLSQSARDKGSKAFLVAKEGLLLSSDVAARGMDFPGVTLVIQAGLPANTEQYIHRLGRTARAGTDGRGIIILDPAEAGFLRSRDIAPLNIQPSTCPADLDLEHREVAHALTTAVDEDTKAQAYRAWLGYYKGSLKLLKWDPERLVRQGNEYVRDVLRWKDVDVPGVEPKLVGKMGMKGVKGFNIVKPPPGERDGRGRGGPRQPRQEAFKALAESPSGAR